MSHVAYSSIGISEGRYPMSQEKYGKKNPVNFYSQAHAYTQFLNTHVIGISYIGDMRAIWGKESLKNFVN